MTYSELAGKIEELIGSAAYRRNKFALVSTLQKQSKQFENITPQEINAFEREPHRLKAAAQASPEKLRAFSALLQSVIPEFNIPGSFVRDDDDAIYEERPMFSLPVIRLNDRHFMAYTSVEDVIGLIRDDKLVGNFAYQDGANTCGLVHEALCINANSDTQSQIAGLIMRGEFIFEPISVVLLDEYSQAEFDMVHQVLKWRGAMLSVKPELVKAIELAGINAASIDSPFKETPCPLSIHRMNRDMFRKMLLAQHIQMNGNARLEYMIRHTFAVQILDYIKNPDNGLCYEVLNDLYFRQKNRSLSPAYFAHAIQRSYQPDKAEDVNRLGLWIVDVFNATADYYKSLPRGGGEPVFPWQTSQWVFVSLIILSKLLLDEKTGSPNEHWRELLYGILGSGHSISRLALEVEPTNRFVSKDAVYKSLLDKLEACMKEVYVNG